MTLSRVSRPATRLAIVTFLTLWGGIGCATIRVTDPPRTATEQMLLTGAAQAAVEQLSADAMRDRVVYVDTTYLTTAWQTAPELSYMIGEFRSRLLKGGARLAPTRDKAQIIIEVRSNGVGVDRLEFLLGIPPIGLSAIAGAVGGSAAVTPELAILKSTRQYGFASVAFVAYWADTGELLASSGPFVGRTFREDWWIFGTGPRTVGDIPPAQRRREGEGGG